MKLSKKLFIGTSSLMLSAAAIVAPISCEKNESQNVFAKVNNDTAIYNVATVTRGDKFIEHILNEINVQMPDVFTEFAPSDEAKLKNVEKYLNDAFPGASKIKLVNHSSTYTLDFSGVKKNIEELRKTAALGYDNMKLVKHADAKDKAEFGTALGLMVGDVVPIDYSKMILGMKASNSSTFLEMLDFAKLPTHEITDAELKAEDPWGWGFGTHKSGDVIPTWNVIINTHPYLNMLHEYHKVLWQFKNSKFFNEWGQEKTFSVATTTGKSGGPTYTDGEKKEVHASGGELFDKSDAMSFPDISTNKPKFTPETSNLEVSFFYRLLRIDKAI